MVIEFSRSKDHIKLCTKLWDLNKILTWSVTCHDKTLYYFQINTFKHDEKKCEKLIIWVNFLIPRTITLHNIIRQIQIRTWTVNCHDKIKVWKTDYLSEVKGPPHCKKTSDLNKIKSWSVTCHDKTIHQISN